MCVSTPGHTWLPLLWYPHQGGLTWDHTPQHPELKERGRDLWVHGLDTKTVMQRKERMNVVVVARVV